MATVANNNSNGRHINQQTMRANNYEKIVFDSSGGQRQRWWRWCSKAAGMDDNKAVARQQRQRGGHNNQMKMKYDGGGGRVVRRRRQWKKARRQSIPLRRRWTTVRQWHDKTQRQQQNKSKRWMQCGRTRASKNSRRRYRMMGVGGQQVKRGKVGLWLPFSGVSTYRSPETDTTTSQRMRGVRQEEVAMCESFGSRGKRQEDVT